MATGQLKAVSYFDSSFIPCFCLYVCLSSHKKKVRANRQYWWHPLKVLALVTAFPWNCDVTTAAYLQPAKVTS